MAVLLRVGGHEDVLRDRLELPSTLNPKQKPKTLNPHPQTLNPKPKTLIPKPKLARA